MTRPILNGMCGLALSLIMWKLTGSFFGWLALFIPGAALVLWGWVVLIYRRKDWY